MQSKVKFEYQSVVALGPREAKQNPDQNVSLYTGSNSLGLLNTLRLTESTLYVQCSTIFETALLSGRSPGFVRFSF
jgi:hypothetical protein